MAAAMAYIYYRLIKEGVRTIDEVPATVRDDVAALIAADGEANGD